jgi:hypothetical protein
LLITLDLSQLGTRTMTEPTPRNIVIVKRFTETMHFRRSLKYSMTVFGEEDLPLERESITNGVPCECIDKRQHIIEWLQDARANLDQPEVRAGCMPLQRLHSSLSSLRGILRIKQRVCCIPANVAVIDWHDDDARQRSIDDRLNYSQASSIY